MLAFDWDEAKASQNRTKHRVSFEEATQAFLDPFVIEWIDLREPYPDERVVLLGMSPNGILLVVYAERSDRIRIISARKATKHEQARYYRENAA